MVWNLASLGGGVSVPVMVCLGAQVRRNPCRCRPMDSMFRLTSVPGTISIIHVHLKPQNTLLLRCDLGLRGDVLSLCSTATHPTGLSTGLSGDGI